VSTFDVSSSLFFRHRQGQKVEGQGQKVKWKLCTKHQIYAENVIG